MPDRNGSCRNPLRRMGLSLLLLLLASPLFGAFLRNVPQTIRQPNGQVIACFATGDEYYSWLHDAAGYTIIQDPETGYYMYAVRNEAGELAASTYPAASVDPVAVGLARWALPSPRALELIRSNAQAAQAADLPVPAPRTGTIKNIVVFIRFSGESEFTDPIATYTSMFNAATVGANSMLNYFLEASYNALSVETSFFPTPGVFVVSYQDGNPRGYFQPYNAVTNPIGYQGGNDGAERTTREHTLLKNAVDSVSAQIPGGLAVDGDGDGYVDNVCFIVSGSPTGWSSLLWPHKWALYTQTAFINGKRVWTYNFQLQSYLLTNGVGVLCHEMFHSLGAPDLYHYSYDGLAPVYTWDIMENDENPPQHMGAYMKYRYGTWIGSIPEITAPGTYTLNPLTSSLNNCYKIRSPFSSTEFFVLEYRRKTGTFESQIPGSGLLVYRINTARDGLGNREGPPDEVYIYRPNGTLSTNGSPASAHFSSDVSRTAIDDATNPWSFLSTGGPGGLQISGIGSAGGTISFQVGPTTPPDPCTTTIACSQSVSGTFAAGCLSTQRAGSYAKHYTFTGTAGQLVTIGLAALGVDTYLYLRAPNGIIEAADDDGGGGTNSRIAGALAQTGTYTIEATTYYAAKTGSFSLDLTCGSGGSCTTAIACPQNVAGTFEPGCDSAQRPGCYAKLYTFTGTAGQQMTVDLSSAADTYLYLKAPNGSVEASDDDGGGGTNSQIIIVLAQSGTYTIEATTYYAGKTSGFDLGLACSSGGACSTAIVCPQTATGMFAVGCASTQRAGSYARFYTFAGVAGQQVTIGLAAAEADTYLYLKAPNGAVEASDDDSGGGTNSRIAKALAQTGTYTIEATTYYAAKTGSFSLDLTCGSGGACTTAIACPQNVAGTFEAGCDSAQRPGSFAKLYTFAGTAGQQVTIDLSAVGVDTYLYLRAPNGAVEASDDDSGGGTNSRIVKALAQSGTYTIEATTYYAGRSGSFTLGLACGGIPPAPSASGRGSIKGDTPEAGSASGVRR